MSTGDYGAFRVSGAGGGAGIVSTARGRGAVASASAQASDLAVAVLQDGGNAFDAAFATAFALAVTHPQAGNLGGGGYLLFKARGAAPRVFNYREQAPAGARLQDFLRADGSPDPDRTAFGPASVCVPGTVKAFFALQAGHGRLAAADLLDRVAALADRGAVLTQYEADCLNRLAPRLAASPEAARIYCRPTPWAAGDLLPNPALGATLRVLSREGADAFYRGSIARQIVADLSAHGGFLTMEDLAAYGLREVDPVALDVDGRRVWTVPPEGGGALLLQILAILDRPEARAAPTGSAARHHLLAQACKMAFIDRMDYLGDVPLAGNATWRDLLSPERNARLFGLIDPARDTPTDGLAARMAAPAGGAGRDAGVDTTHFAIVDPEGNAVSNSYTMNLRYGSKWAVEGAGFLLNGSMDSFSFVTGTENYFGVRGSRPNLFAPGKRPASNMAPVLVTRGDDVEAALGTPGGPTIPTTLAALLLAVLEGTPPARAVAAGRLHHQGWPDVLSHEPSFDRPDLLHALAALGYPLKDKHETIADVQGVFRDGDALLAVSDHRREGQARALP